MNTPSSLDPNPPHALGSVLVVDDEPSILAISSAILNTVAMTPLKAANGEEAIDLVKAKYANGGSISVAIVDLTMPGGLSGFETMEALKKIDPAIKAIACSGFFQDGALELCKSIGFSNILAKPYTPDSFISMIRRTQTEPTQLDRHTPTPTSQMDSIKPSPSALAHRLQSQHPTDKPHHAVTSLFRSSGAEPSLDTCNTFATPTHAK
jgi:CheY-like chemotaxis protein